MRPLSSSRSLWGHGARVGVDRQGHYHQPGRHHGTRKTERRPSPIEVRLVRMLEVSNYVRPDVLNPDHPDRAVAVLRKAKMVLYSTTRQLWAPDVGTYDWLVATKQRMTRFNITDDLKEQSYVDANRLRAPRRRPRKIVPVRATGDRQPVRQQSA